MAQDPFCGHLFVFRGRCGDLIKVLWRTGQGVCMLPSGWRRSRYLDLAANGKVAITRTQLAMLLEGIDRPRLRRRGAAGTYLASNCALRPSWADQRRQLWRL